MRPFLINGNPASYNWLKAAGFDIFEDMWCGHNLFVSTTDEEHASKITSIISFYANFTESELFELYNNLKPRLLYNRELFFKYARQQEEIVNNIIPHIQKIFNYK
jgi:hypothetical protein